MLNENTKIRTFIEHLTDSKQKKRNESMISNRAFIFTFRLGVEDVEWENIFVV